MLIATENITELKNEILPKSYFVLITIYCQYFEVYVQGISLESQQSNLALLRIKILIFADNLGPMCL